MVDQSSISSASEPYWTQIDDNLLINYRKQISQQPQIYRGLYIADTENPIDTAVHVFEEQGKHFMRSVEKLKKLEGHPNVEQFVYMTEKEK